MEGLKPSDALKPTRKENYARLDAREMPELLRKIEGYQGTSTTRLAMKLLALTFVRTGELIRARWEEFDFDAAEWRIPAAVMKMRTPHIVPWRRRRSRCCGRCRPSRARRSCSSPASVTTKSP
jgi:integrase